MGVKGVRRHFISRQQPLVSGAAAYLARNEEGRNLNLGATMAVVPTRQAGRRLRERLAVLAASRGGAAFPPLTVTPEFLVSHGIPEGAAATPSDSLFAWTAVLGEIRFEEFEALFPQGGAKSFSWALHTARELARVKRLLGEGGRCMEDVFAELGNDFADAPRWRELAELERRYRARLKRAGLRDAEEAKIACAADPVLPERIERVVLLGTPDPLPLAVEALERLSRSVSVEVVVYAGENEADLFDAWGRPRVEAWEHEIVEVPDEANTIHPSAGPMEQALCAAELISACGNPERTAAIGVCDAEVTPFLERALVRHCGVEMFDPEGVALGSEELFVLLRTLRAVCVERTFAAAGELLRCPLFLAYVRGRLGATSAASLLGAWDSFHQYRLPGSLEEACKLAKRGKEETDATVHKILAAMETVVETLGRETIWDTLPGMLQTIHGGLEFDMKVETDRRYAAAAAEFMSLMEGWRRSPLAGVCPRGADALEAVMVLLAERRLDPAPAGDNMVEAQGWLELLWEDAPCLVLTGLNENRVPETIVGDPFVPEELRRRLGLKSNRMRFARDLYIFRSLLESRRENGRVDMIFGRASEAGEPLKPSRLLLRCSRDRLPGRAVLLFEDRPSEGAKPAWRPPWRLTPRVVQRPEKISVTQFGRYLECPFRFYLSDMLKMDTLDPRKAEMDGGEFGDLCHRVLEAFGRDERVRTSADPHEIEAFFLGELDVVCELRFGKSLSVPLMIQKEAAAQRLAALAAVQAGERTKGWIIERVEWRFEERPDLKIGGLALRGKIDRIERNEVSGAYRVLDYKTADTSRAPGDEHLQKLKKNESPEAYPEYALFTRGDNVCRWTGLQLPLYLWGLRDELGERIECGYFNLPKAVGETGVREWEELDGELFESAIRCAEGAGKDIEDGRFWPPARSVKYEAFETLLFGDAEATAREPEPFAGTV